MRGYLRYLKTGVLAAGVLLAGFGFQRVRASEGKSAGASECSFLADPGEFREAEQRFRVESASRVARLGKSLNAAGVRRSVPASSIPVANFIDAEIFRRLAADNTPSAELSTDQEYLRRLYLDLAGRLPSAAEVRGFLEDSSADKRAALREKLLYSDEFTDKWTMWLGDLVKNTWVSTNVNRQANGRNAFYRWIRQAVAADKSLRDVAYEVLSARGNNFDPDGAAANFTVRSITPMGPIQDQWDTAFSNAASTFLGLGYYDCLLCHNGRGHLDEISLWGSKVPRVEAQQMAAFFSRQTITGRPGGAPACEAWQSCTGMFYNGSFDVGDRITGSYPLNTNFGNRPNRTPIGTTNQLTPEYRVTGVKPRNNYWREEFAMNLAQDPMFARNFANRLWKAMFNAGLVEPLDAMDPARMDPSNPPPGGWELQASHPELLEKLAAFAKDTNFQIRPFLRLLAESSAYQLSSRYDAEWTPLHVQRFVRHLARRLEGEEIHDAIVKATEVPGSYPITGLDKPVEWAVQMPEPVEPRGNQGNALNFMNTFFRGNRDTLDRRQSGSIQQQLGLMNDSFVLNRVRVAASPKLRAIAAMTSNDALADELFLTFLSRYPSEHERNVVLTTLSRANNATLRNNAVEDLAWSVINKVEFIFSY
ncbi:MAG: DUF1553 domain-containing protein [Bryobacteraceae bacterium]